MGYFVFRIKLYGFSYKVQRFLRLSLHSPSLAKGNESIHEIWKKLYGAGEALHSLVILISPPVNLTELVLRVGVSRISGQLQLELFLGFKERRLISARVQDSN